MATLNYGRVDIRALSYSRASMLHGCPRKYYLEQNYKVSSAEPSNTFAFGHSVGRGIQETAAGTSRDLTILRTMLEWDLDIFSLGTDSEQRALKSFWYAMDAAAKFWDLCADPRTSLLDGWEVAMIKTPDGKVHSGIELEFSIDCGPDSDWENAYDYDPEVPAPHFIYEGHIDCLLVNKERTKFRVLEIKTNSGMQIDPSQYQNSKQASGYSVMVDFAAKQYGMSSAYEVLYIIYKTKTQEFVPYAFPKSFTHRAEFLLGLATDIQIIQLYNRNDFWPQNGGECYSFFRPCKHLAICGMSRNNLETYLNHSNLAVSFKEDEEFAPFKFSLDDLINRQQELAIEVVNA